MNPCPSQHNLPRVLFVSSHSPPISVPSRRQCESYNRLLLQEAIASEESAPKGDDLEGLVDADGEDDKTYAAMGVAKTFSTVGYWLELGVTYMLTILQIVSSIDSSPVSRCHKYRRSSFRSSRKLSRKKSLVRGRNMRHEVLRAH